MIDLGHVQTVVTTLISGSPRAKRRRFSAISSPAAAHHAAGPAGIVRRHDDVRQLVERMARAAAVRLGGGRVLPPHVERGAAELAVTRSAA